MSGDSSARERRAMLGAAALVCAIYMAPLAAWHSLLAWMERPLAIGEAVVVELPPGGNLTRFLAALHERGIVQHPLRLRFYARAKGIADRVSAGEYLIEPGMSPAALLRKLVDGVVVQYPLTIIEGTRMADALQLLAQAPKLRSRLAGADTSATLKTLGIDHRWPSDEGLLFPDTYHYHLGMSDTDILRQAYQRLMRILQQEWEARDAQLPYRDAYEALIMASLVEKETGVVEERARIAGVFVRRLQRGMLLQTDPSVIYGLGEAFDGNLRRADLKRPGPYNTYLLPGLPPTPIAFAGRAAIVAALHPEPGDALYFVARGDGTHQFSATLQEHNRAVRILQQRRRAADYRSSPPRPGESGEKKP